jgi:hypothetical protein
MELPHEQFLENINNQEPKKYTMKQIESKEGDSTHYIATIILVLFVFLGCCVIIGTYLHDRRKNRDK